MKYISSMLFVMCIFEYAFLAAPSDSKNRVKANGKSRRLSVF